MRIKASPSGTRADLNVVGSSTFGRYNKISSEKTVNMFISDDWLVNFAGWKRALDLLPEGRGRGIFHSVRGNILVAVVNSSVYSIDSNLYITLIGNLQSSTSEVFMDENLSNQICIVDGIYAYIYNHSLAPNLTVQNLNPSFTPKHVSYHNTFFLFGNADTTSSGSAWYVYEYADPNNIQFNFQGALQTKPDYALAIKRIPGQANNILVLGSSVCEIFTQIAGVDRYRRNSTINIDYGCLSVSTIASSDEYIAWLGINENNAPVILVYSGQGAQRISTDGIDYVLSQLKRPDKCTAMFYRQDGHLFYQLTFYDKKDNLTLMYDFNTKMFFNLSDSYLNYHPAVDVVYFNQKSYFLSLNNASMYEISTNYTTYDENLIGRTYDPSLDHEIQRIRICKSIRSDDSARFIANSCVITIEQGCDDSYTNVSTVDYLVTEYLLDQIITETGDKMVDEDSFGSDDPYAIQNLAQYRPRVDLSLSYDGGITFGNTVARDLNPLGYRKNMLTWEKMGQANDLTLKFRFWGSGRFIVNSGFVELC